MATGIKPLEPASAEVAPFFKPGAHVPALDGLRGIAILMVLFIHFYQRTWIVDLYPTAGKILGRLVSPGAYGVELFFVLSGFLITGILLDTRGQNGSLLKFYMRRILRIFPLYYGSLVVLFWLLPLLASFDSGAVNIQSQQRWLWLYLINLPGVSYIWDDSNLFMVGHFWSLCVEEHFYILWPLFVFWQSRRTVMTAGVVLMAVALTARVTTGIFAESAPAVLQWNTLQKIDGLALGGILAALLREPRLRFLLPTGRLLILLTGILLCIFVALALVPRGLKDGPIKWIGETLIVLFFGVLLLRSLECDPKGSLGRVLRSKFLGAFGKIQLRHLRDPRNCASRVFANV